MKTRRLVLSAIFAALIAVFTFLIRIPVPGLPTGYIHPGDSVIFIAAYILGGYMSVLCAAVGSALADLFAGADIFILGTFLVKGLMCWAASAFFRRCTRKNWWGNLIGGTVAGGLIMVAGYFLYEWLLFGMEAALVEIPFNLIQFAFAAVVGIIVIRALKKYRLAS